MTNVTAISTEQQKEMKYILDAYEGVGIPVQWIRDLPAHKQIEAMNKIEAKIKEAGIGCKPTTDKVVRANFNQNK